MGTAEQDVYTVVAAITAAIIVTVSVLVGVWTFFRDRAMRTQLASMKIDFEKLQKELGGNDDTKEFQTLEALMKPYKKHLLQSAFSLASRLTQQVHKDFLYTFRQRSEKKARAEKDRVPAEKMGDPAEKVGDPAKKVAAEKVAVEKAKAENDRDCNYAIKSTAYMFAEFLAWMEVIRREIVFVTGAEYAESLNSLMDALRFQLTGETCFQGYDKVVTANGEFYDKESSIMQLYIVDLRSIGITMLNTDDKDDEDISRPISVDKFYERMDGEGDKDVTFQAIMQPMMEHITKLSTLPPSESPKRRLAIFQVLLCKLIAILDAAVPWDYGPKFDVKEEPMYCERGLRLIPLVDMLTSKQRKYLEESIFFDDDPNLSFPGFREDLKYKNSQQERDRLLWPGACPPIQSRTRPDSYKFQHLISNNSTLRLRRGNSSSTNNVYIQNTTHDRTATVATSVNIRGFTKDSAGDKGPAGDIKAEKDEDKLERFFIEAPNRMEAQIEAAERILWPTATPSSTNSDGSLKEQSSNWEDQAIAASLAGRQPYTMPPSRASTPLSAQQLDRMSSPNSITAGSPTLHSEDSMDPFKRAPNDMPSRLAPVLPPMPDHRPSLQPHASGSRPSTAPTGGVDQQEPSTHPFSGLHKSLHVVGSASKGRLRAESLNEILEDRGSEPVGGLPSVVPSGTDTVPPGVTDSVRHIVQEVGEKFRDHTHLKD